MRQFFKFPFKKKLKKLELKYLTLVFKKFIIIYIQDLYAVMNNNVTITVILITKQKILDNTREYQITLLKLFIYLLSMLLRK